MFIVNPLPSRGFTRNIKSYFYAPNFGEVEGHIGLGLSISPSVCLSVTQLAAEKLKNRLC